VMPQNRRKLRLYDDDIPLFSRYQIESQIESAFQREVRLPSGGSIVIDHTEALTSVDINSARATKGTDIEETALNTNLESADEIARQLRLRDMGGLIVIDFIDMTPARNQRAVENQLKDAMKQDRARVQVGRISRFGLLELSRQRLRPALGESSQHVCPRCKGHGFIRGVESLALSVLRIIEEQTMKENTARIVVQLPVDVATFLLNEKRQSIYDIEKRQSVNVVLVPNSHFETPNYEVERIRSQDLPGQDSETTSYQMVTEPESDVPQHIMPKEPKGEEPAVKRITPPSPAPQPKAEPAKPGLIQRMFGGIFGKDAEEQPKAEEKPKQEQRKRQSTTRPSERGQSNRSRSRRGSSNSAVRAPRRQTSQQKGKQQSRTTQSSRSGESVTKAEPKTRPQPANPTDETKGGTQEKRPSTRRGRRGGRRRRSSGGGRAQDPNVAAARESESQPNTESQKDRQKPVAADTQIQGENKGGAAKSTRENRPSSGRGRPPRQQNSTGKPVQNEANSADTTKEFRVSARQPSSSLHTREPSKERPVSREEDTVKAQPAQIQDRPQKSEPKATEQKPVPTSAPSSAAEPKIEGKPAPVPTKPKDVTSAPAHSEAPKPQEKPAPAPTAKPDQEKPAPASDRKDTPRSGLTEPTVQNTTQPADKV